MGRFRKKPVVVEAFRFHGDVVNYEQIESWSQGKVYIRGVKLPIEKREMECEALGGTVRAVVGDWIIRGVKGEFYPCKPDIFEATYEEVSDGTS